MEMLNCIKSCCGGKVLEVVTDGSYPDFMWELYVPISRDAGLALLGMPLDKANHNTLTNKCFCVYTLGSDYAYAIYNHDGDWSIIRARIKAFERHLRSSNCPHPSQRGLRESTLCDNSCCKTYVVPGIVDV